MGLLDSRYLTSYPHMQPMSASFYSTRIIVMRKRLVTGHVLNDGVMGANVNEWYRVTRGWPASIVPRVSELESPPPGQTEIGDYVLVTQFRNMADGGLLIRERDIVIDMRKQNKGAPQKFLVLWSHDPADQGIQIVAGLQYGVVVEDYTEVYP